MILGGGGGGGGPRPHNASVGLGFSQYLARNSPTTIQTLLAARIPRWKVDGSMAPRHNGRLAGRIKSGSLIVQTFVVRGSIRFPPIHSHGGGVGASSVVPEDGDNNVFGERRHCGTVWSRLV